MFMGTAKKYKLCVMSTTTKGWESLMKFIVFSEEVILLEWLDAQEEQKNKNYQLPLDKCFYFPHASICFPNLMLDSKMLKAVLEKDI